MKFGLPLPQHRQIVFGDIVPENEGGARSKVVQFLYSFASGELTCQQDVPVGIRPPRANLVDYIAFDRRFQVEAKAFWLKATDTH